MKIKTVTTTEVEMDIQFPIFRRYGGLNMILAEDKMVEITSNGLKIYTGIEIISQTASQKEATKKEFMEVFEQFKKTMHEVMEAVEEDKQDFVDGYVVLMDLGSSFQPTFKEDDKQMFFSTEEEAQAEIDNFISETQDMDGRYSDDDYTICKARKAGDRLFMTVEGVEYTMLETDDDYINLNLYIRHELL